MKKVSGSFRVCMLGRTEDNKTCVFYDKQRGITYHVPRDNVSGSVVKVGWYATLNMFKDGRCTVRMD